MRSRKVDKILKENKKIIEEMEGLQKQIDPKKSVQQIISGQLAERIKRQQEYRKVWLTRLYVQTEIEEMTRQLSGSAQITMQWYGQPFPKKLLGIEHDLKFTQYMEIVSQENYMKQALKNDGLTDEELQQVLKGEFRKHHKMLEESKNKEQQEDEKNGNKKQI